jgi:cytochrome c biogenesis protein CcdA
VSLVAAAVAGGALGARHALEADHLAAIVTLVDDDPSRPGLVGASWGVGHTLPIAALGVSFLLLGVRLPSPVTALFEGVVGLVLVFLGARMLAGVLGYREHDHGTHPLHGHLQVGDLSLGGGHVHLHGDSVLVGALHGVAGSGALVVALVAAAPDLPTGAAFLAAFGVGSVLTMAAASAVWGRTLDAGVRRTLRALAGVVGVAVGCLLLTEVAGVV